MYDIEYKFLYEILDDYKNANTEDKKDEIIKEFMKLIWSSSNKRNVYKKYIRFTVPDHLLSTDIGKIFNMYSEICYMSYRTMTKDIDFVSLIRQKINNLYTNLCDGRVCYKRDYMNQIKLPKQMYYRWLKGEEYDVNNLTSQLEDYLIKAEELKNKYAKQKMDISWTEYKKLIVPYFKRMFENYIPLDDFEDKTVLTIDIDTWCEDNFPISYLCKGLDGYMRMYQKKYYNVPEHKAYGRCKCGGMFVQNKKNNRFKCDECGKYQPIGTKTIKCIDCVEEKQIPAISRQDERCLECYELYRKKYKANKEKERRGKMKVKNVDSSF